MESQTLLDCTNCDSFIEDHEEVFCPYAYEMNGEVIYCGCCSCNLQQCLNEIQRGITMSNLVFKRGEVIKFYRPGKYLVVRGNYNSSEHSWPMVDVINVSDLMNNRKCEIETYLVDKMGHVTHNGRNEQAMRKFNHEYEEESG